MTDLLARVAAIALRETDKASARAAAARRDHPVAATLHDWAAPALGKPARIVETASGYSMGKSLPYRRDGRPLPLIPGVPD